MKNYKNKILIGIGLITLVAAACRKSEKFPVDKVSGIYVFDSRDSAGTNALKYLLNIYSVLKNGHNRVGGDYLDAASDDAVSASPGGQVTVLATDGYGAIDLPADENVWSSQNSTNTANYWNGIRTANEFMAGVGVVPVKDFVAPNGKVNGIGVSTRYIWRNEARLLRAYFYFELVKRFGGVPLLGDKIYNVNDNIALPRNSFADCISYIVSECDKATDSLITVPLLNPAQDNYRITQGAALALKAKVLLYAASPAFNSPSGANSNPLTGYPTYSASRWQLAATAASKIMAMGNYSLDPSFKNIFLTQNDPEVIMLRMANNTGPSNNVEANNGPVGFSSAVAQGRTNPTQQLVDAYPMNNGLPISDPNSGYDVNNPYKNRDPRFAATILYNGAPWLGTSLQTYVGGVSNPGNGQGTLTSYYMCKFMGPQTGSNFQSHDEDWVIFRYAEIKLDFAEARNETDGPVDSVYQQLKDLRIRAGILPGADNSYGLAAGMTKDQMRAVIQNERRIEMAFEEQRYFDIRRWGIASTVMNQPLMGLSITNSNGNLTYNPIQVLQPKFVAPKMNVYPIPYDEVLKNPAIGQAHQNPGWSF